MVAVALIVALAMAVSACSFNAPCRGPYGEPCGGPRSGWPGAVTCPSCWQSGPSGVMRGRTLPPARRRGGRLTPPVY